MIDDEIAPPAALTFATLDGSAVTSGDLPHSLAFDVYVTDRPSLALITSRFEVDGEPIVFTQYFEQATDRWAPRSAAGVGDHRGHLIDGDLPGRRVHTVFSVDRFENPSAFDKMFKR